MVKHLKYKMWSVKYKGNKDCESENFVIMSCGRLNDIFERDIDAE